MATQSILECGDYTAIKSNEKLEHIGGEQAWAFLPSPGHILRSVPGKSDGSEIASFLVTMGAEIQAFHTFLQPPPHVCESITWPLHQR
jgi:hypothetical protein